ncbi:MAG: sugar phosphate isomerase/epimerase [Desulfarculaceae bacterium]|nr:sugar phosphate isomerase/epimerase [Desulfarculaceae bacterium]MCF8072945.1 sugar phosphate isomerase/epimerase [Desulfarculaceae bacterium]MCF8115500.1 sugar phosphate isomerase/epimerase [Desulfarculaceae bacterium]
MTAEVADARDIVFAGKCAPQEELLEAIASAGLAAAEIYLNSAWLAKTEQIAALCARFPLRYAIHAPSDGLDVEPLVALTREMGAEVVVFHDIFWQDEWREIADGFSGANCRVCVENVVAAHEPVRVIRRFGLSRCLDMEHLQMQVNGVFSDEFIPIIAQSSHIHLTGYFNGSEMWHTHLHDSPEHSRKLLGLILRAGYKGMVVSEAMVKHQTPEAFQKLAAFERQWKEDPGARP